VHAESPEVTTFACTFFWLEETERRGRVPKIR